MAHDGHESISGLFSGEAGTLATSAAGSIAREDTEKRLTKVNWRDFSEPTVAPLLQTALTEFVKQGYHGTSIRALALGAGMSVAGLYHHYPSKQDILVQIMELAMEDLFHRSTGALAEAGDSIEDQFRLHIECLVLFHAYRSDLAFVAANEIRALAPEARLRHIEARDRQQAILWAIVTAGVEEGLFDAQFPRESTRAIVTMCTGVAQWYRFGGSLTPEQLADRYVTIAASTVGEKR